MPTKSPPPKKPAKKSSPKAPDVATCRQVSETVSQVTAPHRIAYAVDLLTPREGRPSLRYVDARRAQAEAFGVDERTADRDLAKAYQVIRERLDAVDISATVRMETETIARRSIDDRVRLDAWKYLGKLGGLESNDITVTHKLADADLDAAIQSAVDAEVERLPIERLEALLEKRRAEERDA